MHTSSSTSSPGPQIGFTYTPPGQALSTVEMRFYSPERLCALALADIRAQIHKLNLPIPTGDARHITPPYITTQLVPQYAHGSAAPRVLCTSNAQSSGPERSRQIDGVQRSKAGRGPRASA